MFSVYIAMSVKSAEHFRISEKVLVIILNFECNFCTEIDYFSSEICEM